MNDRCNENEKERQENRITHRVITFLDREQIDFLDKLSKDFMFASGSKLPRTKLLSLMVDIFIKRGLDISKTSSLREIQDKMLSVVTKGGE